MLPDTMHRAAPHNRPSQTDMHFRRTAQPHGSGRCYCRAAVARARKAAYGPHIITSRLQFRALGWSGDRAHQASGWVAISTRATVMLSGAPAAMLAFHSSKAALPPSWLRSMAVIAVSSTASVSPSLQIR